MKERFTAIIVKNDKVYGGHKNGDISVWSIFNEDEKTE